MIQDSKEKLEMAETFMESVNTLEGPFYAIRSNSEEEIEAQRDKQQIQKKQTCHFLYAVIFELAVKIIWETEKGRKCTPTHNILKLYKELSHETQSKMRDLYDKQASIIKSQKGQQNTGKQIHLKDLTKYQSLEEALEANYNIVTNFKYDGHFQGKSSLIGGVIWNNQNLWTLPNNLIVFPRELLEYARELAKSL